jgi:hypothetical protein
MRAYICPECSHRWFEPQDNKRKSGWGCPNGCASSGRLLNLKPTDFIIDTFERMLREDLKEEEKSKIRYHLNLLRKKENYPS